MATGEQGGYGASSRTKWPACSIDVARRLRPHQPHALVGNAALWRVADSAGHRPEAGRAHPGRRCRHRHVVRRRSPSGATVVARRLLARDDRRGPQAPSEDRVRPGGRREAAVRRRRVRRRHDQLRPAQRRTTRRPALAEMYRVLKPGGRLVVCEFSKPPRALLRAGYDAYLRRAMPMVAASRSSNPDAYRYLVESIARVARPGHAEPVDPRCRLQLASPTATSRRASWRCTAAASRTTRRSAPRPPRRADRYADPLRSRDAASPPSPAAARRSARRSGSARSSSRPARSAPFAAAIEEGLEEVEAGLLEQMSLRRRDRRRHQPLPAGGRRQAGAPDARPC